MKSSWATLLTVLLSSGGSRMSSRIAIVPTRQIVTTIALATMLCLCGAYAAAQVTIQPQAEVYAGYSWLQPAGHYDYGQATVDHPDGVDESLVWYTPFAHNLGLLLDSSQHWGVPQ